MPTVMGSRLPRSVRVVVALESLGGNFATQIRIRLLWLLTEPHKLQLCVVLLTIRIRLIMCFVE